MYFFRETQFNPLWAQQGLWTLAFSPFLKKKNLYIIPFEIGNTFTWHEIKGYRTSTPPTLGPEPLSSLARWHQCQNLLGALPEIVSALTSIWAHIMENNSLDVCNRVFFFSFL